jgi:hypothetical protein
MKVSVDGAGSQAHTSIPMFRDKVANSSRFAATPAELEVDVQRQVFDYPGFQLWSSVWDVPFGRRSIVRSCIADRTRTA